VTNSNEVVLKIVTGVTIAVVVAILAFGVQVYGFMAEGPGLTLEDARKEFVDEEVYDRDRAYLKQRLDRMDDKLDRLLEQ